MIEGIALDTRSGLEPLLVHTGIGKLKKIYAIGGSTRNRLLMQIKASVLNQPIHVMSVEESTALGAAVLGGIGAGVYSGVTDAIASLQLSGDVDRAHSCRRRLLRRAVPDGLQADLPSAARHQPPDLRPATEGNGSPMNRLNEQPQVIVAGHVCVDIIPSFGEAVVPLETLLRPGHLTIVGPALVSPRAAPSPTPGLALHRLGIPVRLMGKIGAGSLRRGHPVRSSAATAPPWPTAC